ncbi:DNA-binding transcriptional LysR family regulator [Ilumatobacter fluminis]|uniref:DNA-binding transcriptional LysR family regulator n=1 Tax=Ilumatobacter fluminis TaxID=467091 RepID=A0A4R7I2E4_9ACTN|nr:LysR family transcriptional regulator [Ilumatobacter fluminis]TDT17701.1 DNA-binding transcriptional LysR family regulator [Ilumatobacter fluminis]
MVRALPDISLRQLEYLVAVAEAPTWSVAADRVGVSPSALSQGLGELERRIGVTLFEPDGRRRVLRPAARPVLDHARQVVSLTHDLVDWSDRLRAARSGRVRLGMVDVAAVEHFPHVLRRFRSDRPDVELTLSVAPSADLLDGLRDGSLDLIVCVDPPRWPGGIEVDALLDEPIVVVAPAGTTVGNPSRWGPWVVFPGDSHTRIQIMQHLAELGAPLDVAAESHQADVLRQMVELGLGWTVLPDSAVTADLARGPVLFDRRLVLARRAGSVHDPAADALADALRSA